MQQSKISGIDPKIMRISYIKRCYLFSLRERHTFKRDDIGSLIAACANLKSALLLTYIRINYTGSRDLSVEKYIYNRVELDALL